MFHHIHPYEPFFPKTVIKLIVGTLPPPRFSTGHLKTGDVNFCYGSIDGLLWQVLNRIFNLDLTFETTEEAIEQRKNFLRSRNIGVCDIVQSCKRQKIDASDLGMQEVELRNLIGYLKNYPTVKELIFTGGNSKNGPEYFFRKHLKDYGLTLSLVSDEVPRQYSFELDGRVIKTVSLTAPSGSANRAIGSMSLYKELKQKTPKFNTIDFRVMQYKPFF